MSSSSIPLATICELQNLIRTHPLIDNHAHNTLLSTHSTAYPFESITSEASGLALSDAAKTLSHLRAIKQLSALLGCSPTWEAIKAKRESVIGTDAWARKCLSGTQCLLIDDGLDEEGVEHYTWFDHLTQSPTKRIVRIEKIAERTLMEFVPDFIEYESRSSLQAGDDVDGNGAEAELELFNCWSERFSALINAAMRDPAVAGFKSIVCYRSGLDIVGDPPGRLLLEAVKNALRGSKRQGASYKIRDKVLGDFLVCEVVRLIAKSGSLKPLQFHTGLGDNDINLRKSNPACVPSPPPCIVCYRSGLDIVGDPPGRLLLEAVKNALRGSKRQGASYKIRDKVLGDFLVCEVVRLIAKSGSLKPLQFHTGLGDNDINLRKSNPAYLQNFIKENPHVPIVLLHSSYPFTREAGYLATVYRNVYLDIGEVFPMLSKDGQKAVVKQCLESTPGNKLLWSTDGHWFPETFALANMQMREVLSEVLTKRVTNGQLAIQEAAELTKNLLFENSNKLYKLGLTPLFTPQLLPFGNSIPITPMTQEFTQFLHEHPYVKYFRLQWVDYTNTLRLRIVTVAQMKKMVERSSSLTVAKAVLSLLQTDEPLEDFTPAGKYNIAPDWSSLRVCPGASEIPEERAKHASVMCFFRDGAEEVETCPRTTLSRALRRAKDEHGIDVLVGFETEVVFLDKTNLAPISNVHAWSTSRALQNKCLKVLEQIVDALEQSGIEVLLFHAESAVSQYEIVTGPLPALQAVDALYHIRETIFRICAHHDIRATLHPKPFQDLAGTAAHMHMSITPPNPTLSESFFAGVLSHLGSIAAIAMPMQVSYTRLKASCWAGGTWIAWGEENREVPLRCVSASQAHWELRCIDGLANAYLVLSSVIAAGCIGASESAKLPGPSCDSDPAKMTSRERNSIGITEQLPDGIAKALEVLKRDKKLRQWVGEAVMTKYATTKKGEMKALETVSALKDWIMERY